VEHIAFNLSSGRHEQQSNASRSAPGSPYLPHHPASSCFYQIILAHWLPYKTQQQLQGKNLPYFVANEFEAYLRCGILDYGFARMRCGTCGFERLVGFSCKGRGFCPSCMGRRQAATSTLWLERVIPRVRMRQYVLSLPMTLRFLLARRRELQGVVLGLFLHAVFELLRRKAYEHGLCDHGDDAKPGSVSVVQRFGSSLELNVHFHCLVTDGVFIDLHDGNQPEFYALPAPTQSELESIAWSTCRRVVAKLKRAGLWLDEAETAGLFANDDDDGLNDTYTASICGVIRYGPNAGRRICRVFGEAARPQYQATKRVGAGQSFNVEAGRVVGANDRAGLLRLASYLLRPPFSRERIRARDDGQIEIKLKKSWRDGTTHILLSPMDFISRLAALVPAPKTNTIRYHGVFAPASPLRSRIVPGGESRSHKEKKGKCPASHKSNNDELSSPNTWASLMKRVFAIDVLECPKCKSRMQLISYVKDRRSIREHLKHVGIFGNSPPQSTPV